MTNKPDWSTEVINCDKIPVGHVQIERTDYIYGRQGQITNRYRSVDTVPENKAIQLISGSGTTTIYWPDGNFESINCDHVPCRVDGTTKEMRESKLGYIQRRDMWGNLLTRELVKNSRLENAMYGYYRAMSVTPENKKSFAPCD